MKKLPVIARSMEPYFAFAVMPAPSALADLASPAAVRLAARVRRRRRHRRQSRSIRSCSGAKSVRRFRAAAPRTSQARRKIRTCTTSPQPEAEFGKPPTAARRGKRSLKKNSRFDRRRRHRSRRTTTSSGWRPAKAILVTTSSPAPASTRRPTAARPGPTSVSKRRARLSRISIDPHNPNHVVVAALGDIYAAEHDRGIYVTEDGGKTWQKTLYVSDRAAVRTWRWTRRIRTSSYAGMWHFHAQAVDDEQRRRR